MQERQISDVSFLNFHFCKPLLIVYNLLKSLLPNHKLKWRYLTFTYFKKKMGFHMRLSCIGGAIRGYLKYDPCKIREVRKGGQRLLGKL